MASWIIYNETQNRQEVEAVYPNQADAEAAVTRLQASRDRVGQPPITLSPESVKCDTTYSN
jgi:hypothetical protein